VVSTTGKVHKPANDVTRRFDTFNPFDAFSGLPVVCLSRPFFERVFELPQGIQSVKSPHQMFGPGIFEEQPRDRPRFQSHTLNVFVGNSSTLAQVRPHTTPALITHDSR
jgi:hypothetical protein